MDWNPFRRKPELSEDVLRRVPPGQYLTEKWPVLHYGSVPRFKPENWDLKVNGLVEHPLELNYEQFMALPTQTVHCDIHCVTTWSKLDNDFEGVPFSWLLEQVKPKPEAKYVMAYCEAGYTTNIPLADLMRPEILLAYRHNGENLTLDHGWPLRLLVPHLYFWKSAKWLRGLEFMAEDRAGFWENYGYHMYGDPWKEQRYWES